MDDTGDEGFGVLGDALAVLVVLLVLLGLEERRHEAWIGD